MGTTANQFRFVMPSAGTNPIKLKAKASTAISIGDICYQDPTTREVISGSTQVSGVNDSVAACALNFIGVATSAVPATQTPVGGYPSTTGNHIMIDPDPIYLADISSTSSVVLGTQVVPVVGSDTAVAISNVQANNIGIAIEEYNSLTITKLRVQLTSKYSKAKWAYNRTLATTTTT